MNQHQSAVPLPWPTERRYFYQLEKKEKNARSAVLGGAVFMSGRKRARVNPAVLGSRDSAHSQRLKALFVV